MKWIFRLLSIVVALVVLLVGAVFFLPAERLARIATEQLAAATGRDVSINGDVRLSFWPVLGVSADDLQVGNADWAARGPMFEAANAAIGVDALSLLSGDIRITNVEAHSPVIRLEQKRDGRASWQFSDGGGEAQIVTETQPSAGKATASGRSISIERLEITDATLIYDAEGSDLVSLTGVDLSLDWPDPAGPAGIKPTPKSILVFLRPAVLSQAPSCWRRAIRMHFCARSACPARNCRRSWAAA